MQPLFVCERGEGGGQDSISTVMKIAQLQSKPAPSVIAATYTAINALRVCSLSVHYTSVRQMAAEIMIHVVKVAQLHCSLSRVGEAN
jgi:hypothetical protein